MALIIFLIVNTVLLTVILIKMLLQSSDKKGDNVLEKLIRLEGVVGTLLTRQDDVRKETGANLEMIRETLERRVRGLQEDNAKKLEEMRVTVDEKLQASVEKRFSESFKKISDQLEQVYKGLGEMLTLKTDVGALNRTLSGVKTRGSFGEVQLWALLEDTLMPEQYVKNFAVKEGSLERVEFAVKMPGQMEGSSVYLPIDSKFPMENYTRLIDAAEQADKAGIEAAEKALAGDIKTQAKKILEKYIEPPHTTEYGIMFVPTESLYAEIMRIPGLSEQVRRTYNVAIVGPSTMAAFLNSLLMGFRTLAIEKKSGEVWKILGAAKTQFGKFGDILSSAKKRLEQTVQMIDSTEVRSRAIERALRTVEELPETESSLLIGTAEKDELSPEKLLPEDWNVNENALG